jgi:hypothetical protein
MWIINTMRTPETNHRDGMSCALQLQQTHAVDPILLCDHRIHTTNHPVSPTTPRASHKYKTFPSQPPQPSSCILCQTRSTPVLSPSPYSSHGTNTPSPACLKLSPWRPLAPCPRAGRDWRRAPRKASFWTFSFQDFLVSPFRSCLDEGNGSEDDDLVPK